MDRLSNYHLLVVMHFEHTHLRNTFNQLIYILVDPLCHSSVALNKKQVHLNSPLNTTDVSQVGTPPFHYIGQESN